MENDHITLMEPFSCLSTKYTVPSSVAINAVVDALLSIKTFHQKITKMSCTILYRKIKIEITKRKMKEIRNYKKRKMKERAKKSPSQILTCLQMLLKLSINKLEYVHNLFLACFKSLTSFMKEAYVELILTPLP